MGTTRFSGPFNNKTLRFPTSGTFPRVINGDTANYPSAPAKSEEAAYPMSNVHAPDRYIPWVTALGSTPTPFNFQIDLGSDVAVAYFAAFAIRQFATTPANIQYDVGYRTNGSGYSASGYASAASGNMGSSARDFGASVTAPNARYWQITLTAMPAAGVSFGGFYLGTVAQDMGFLYSKGETEQTIHTTIQNRTGAGHLTSIKVGDPRMLVSMPFRSIKDADRQKIDVIFGSQSQRDPALWIDRADVARQVVLANDTLAWTHAWAPPNAWDCDLELEVLG